MNRHLVLVPGFGGFDALGSLRYYEGVTDVLTGAPLVLHYFPNLPTASVATRAERLLVFLEDLWLRKEILPEDELHLAGHSTGGLDLRQLLLNYRDLERAPGSRRDGAALEMLGRVRSVQFLSTPQRGTNLVRRLSQPLARELLLRPLLRSLYEGTRALRQRGTSDGARLLRMVLLRGKHQESANWIDAVLDTLQDCDSHEGAYPSAVARTLYFQMLDWLLNMASDSSALSDLNPVRLAGAPPSPAHEDNPEAERRFLEEHRIRYASIVSVARPRSEQWFDLFNRLHAFTAESPDSRLGAPQRVRKLLEPGATQQVELADNDGFVNTVSQVWPDGASSYLIDADHADVIGHYKAETLDSPVGPLKRYDLLNSASGFEARTFEALWTRIAAFTEGRTYDEPGRPLRLGGG